MNEQWSLTPKKLLNNTEMSHMLNRAEELWVLGLARKSKQPVRDAFLIWTALFTGMRNSEICNLKTSSLKIGNGESHIVVIGKGSKERCIHIGKQYKSILKQYLAWKRDNGEIPADGSTGFDTYLLRTERAEKYCVSALWRRWRKHCNKTLHSSRHTYATLVYKSSGHNLRAVQKLLGHSRVSTTQIYSDVMPEEMEESVNCMEKLANAIRKGNGNKADNRMPLNHTTPELSVVAGNVGNVRAG